MIAINGRVEALCIDWLVTGLDCSRLVVVRSKEIMIAVLQGRQLGEAYFAIAHVEVEPLAVSTRLLVDLRSVRVEAGVAFFNFVERVEFGYVIVYKMVLRPGFARSFD